MSLKYSINDSVPIFNDPLFIRMYDETTVIGERFFGGISNVIKFFTAFRPIIKIRPTFLEQADIFFSNILSDTIYKHF